MRALITTLGLALLFVLVPRAASAQSGTAVAEGATLYGQQCVRCHTARSSMERTDRQWRTIVHHMRARANLTKSQARALLAYLQATNAPEDGSSTDEARSEEAREGNPGRADSESRESGAPLVLELSGQKLAPEIRAFVATYLERVVER